MIDRFNTAVAAPSPTASAGVPRLAYVLATLPPLFWSGNFLIARLMRDAIPPFQMSFWRWTLAFLVLLPFAVPSLRQDRAQLRREWPFLAVLGAVGVTAFNCLIYVALHHTTVVNAAFMNSLTPVVTFLFALVLLRNRLTSRQVVGILISLIGAVVIISRGQPAQLFGLGFNRGDLLVLLGLTFWAAYTVLIRWRRTALRPITFLASTVGFGALLHVPLVLWELGAKGGFAVTPAAALSLLYFAIFPSLLAYIFWNRAVAALGPGRTGMFMHLMPMFSALLAVTFLDEPFLSYHAIGIGLVFLGIALVTGPPVRRATNP